MFDNDNGLHKSGAVNVISCDMLSKGSRLDV
jgi:hypothetical protein